MRISTTKTKSTTNTLIILTRTKSIILARMSIIMSIGIPILTETRGLFIVKLAKFQTTIACFVTYHDLPLEQINYWSVGISGTTCTSKFNLAHNDSNITIFNYWYDDWCIKFFRNDMKFKKLLKKDKRKWFGFSDPAHFIKLLVME